MTRQEIAYKRATLEMARKALAAKIAAGNAPHMVEFYRGAIAKMERELAEVAR